MASSRSSARSTATPRAARPQARPAVGRETPRIFTAPLRRLEPRSAATERRTLGYAVIDFAEQVLGMRLLPWQRWLLVHMLELLPDGSLRFRTVVVLVARQNGKSTLSVVVALFFMYVRGAPLVIGTAQDLDVAEEIWQSAVDVAEDTDELAELISQVVKVNGKKSLNLVTGERYKVKAANRRAGRGLSGDLILLDELREHQSWDAWGAITKTTMARSQALVLAMSNAGDSSSVVLRYLRMLAHVALGNPDGLDVETVDRPDDEEPDEEPDDDSLGIFEWSAAPGCALNDRGGIAQANPALGHTITERAIRSARHTDPEWVYRTEVLCQWAAGALDGPFPAGAWESTLDGRSTIGEGQPILIGVDVSVDRSTTHVAFAGLRQDGQPHVEIVESRPGTEWLAGWLEERRARWPALGDVVGQGKGAPVSDLLDELANVGQPVRRWEGAHLASGTGAFYDLVCKGELRRLAQPLLDVAAANATTKPLADRFVWDRRRSPVDIAPLVAANAAVWALTSEPDRKPEPRIRRLGG